MGNRMTCSTTPRNAVRQGAANHCQTVAAPPPPPTGAGGGGDAAEPLRGVVRQPTANLQPFLTVKQAAMLMNVSERSVYMARAVHRLRPDLAALLDAGTMSLASAYRMATNKAAQTSWDRLVSSWNKATDADRTRLMDEADLVPKRCMPNV